MGTVGDLVVGPSGDDHTEDTTADGDECTDEEGEGSPEALLSEEKQDDEHDRHEDEADQILTFKELLGSFGDPVSEFEELELLFLGDVVADVAVVVADVAPTDADLLYLPDVDNCPDNSDEAADDDDDYFDRVTHGASTAITLGPGDLEVLYTLVNLEHALTLNKNYLLIY